MEHNPLLTAALAYRGAGLSAITCDLKNKQPIVGPWKTFQSVSPTEEQIRQWNWGRPDACIAIVCGAVSGNLGMLDFDFGGEWAKHWRENLTRRCGGLFAKLVVERSQSGGFHAIYRCSAPVPGNTKLARKLHEVQTNEPCQYNGMGKKLDPFQQDGKLYIAPCLIETRGQGGYFVCAPSSGYQLRQGDFYHLPMLSAEEQQMLFDAAIELNEYDPKRVQKKTVHPALTLVAQSPQPSGLTFPQGEPSTWHGESTADAYSRSGEVLKALEKHGWSYCGEQGHNSLYARPGKDPCEGHSATFDGNVFFVFSTNAVPFEGGQGYSGFDVYAILEHGGNRSAAAKLLYAQGYGGRQAKGQKAQVAGTSGDTKNTEGKEETGKVTQASMLVGFADAAILFHSPDNKCFAVVDQDGCNQTYALKSGDFRRWLTSKFYTATGKSPGNQALQDAVNVLEARACFDGECQPVHVRLAFFGGSLYLDLADEHWRAVEISPDGWKVINEPPVRFIRPKGMTPLPLPQAGGSLADLRSLVNCPDDHQWALLVAWLIGCLHPRGPYPILVVNGEQGSAKTTLSRMVRMLFDPNKSCMRAEPAEARDLMIAASNGWVYALDNLSGIQPWLSDALCRLSTGGGYATRELYTDDSETIFECCRPILVNGIEDLASRSDLLDRCLCISLPTIAEEHRMPESVLWQKFDAARPRILGALLDASVAALRGHATIQLPRLPRMADHARWAVAAESALGLKPGEVMQALESGRENVDAVAIEGNSVASFLLQWMEQRDSEFVGKVSELLKLLDARMSADSGWENRAKRPPMGWPQTAKKLANDLRRMAPNLRRCGLGIDFLTKRQGCCPVRITWVGKPATDQGQAPAQISTEVKPSTWKDLTDGLGEMVQIPARKDAGVAEPEEARWIDELDAFGVMERVLCRRRLIPRECAELAREF